MHIVHLRLGGQVVELTQYVSPPVGRPIPVPSYSNDQWFQHMAIVVRDMDAAYKILQDNNVQQVSAYPIAIPPSNPGAAGIKAIKFHDPERHDLELIYFPSGKGDASWHNPTNKLFLGLDHTAMTIAASDTGVAFYRDLLGLKIGTVTLNTGTTQEVLDGLFNDTCLVTAMLPPSAPPHIEFLDYKTPPGAGRCPRTPKPTISGIGRRRWSPGTSPCSPSDCARQARNSSRPRWFQYHRTRGLSLGSSKPLWCATQPATRYD
jgi:catechol 2,3-dioxygenase-like lactoylglutathione lyase family enzyme